MRKMLLVALLCILIPTLAFAAEKNGACTIEDGASFRVSLPVSNVWYYLACSVSEIGPDGEGGWMYIPPQNDLWQVVGPAQIDLTDAWGSGDFFEIWVDGAPVLTTPAVPAGVSTIIPDVPGGPVPFNDQASCDAAFLSPDYSSGSVLIGEGVHEINIKADYSAGGFSSGGHCIRALAPTATTNTVWGNIKTLW